MINEITLPFIKPEDSQYSTSWDLRSETNLANQRTISLPVWFMSNREFFLVWSLLQLALKCECDFWVLYYWCSITIKHASGDTYNMLSHLLLSLYLSVFLNYYFDLKDTSVFHDFTSVMRLFLCFKIFFCRYFLRQSLLGPALQVISSFKRLLLPGKFPLCNGNCKIVWEQRLPDKGVEKRGDKQNADHRCGDRKSVV